MKTQQDLFEDAARWARYGMECFLGNTVFIGLVFFFPFLAGASKELLDFMVFRIIAFISLIFICVFLAWFTKIKVINPLQRKELPKHIRAWTIVLSILGLFFGMIIGLVIMGYADEKIKLLIK